MLNEQDKKNTEEIIKSEYFDYLIERAVKKKISDIWGRWKIFVAAILALILGVSSFFGIRLNEASNKVERIQKEVQQKHDKASEILVNLNKRDIELKDRMEKSKEELENLKETIAFRKEMSDIRKELYEGSLKELAAKTEKNVAELKNALADNQKANIKLDFSIAKADSHSKALSEEKESIKREASKTYVYIERGAQSKEDETYYNKYRPKTIELPYSDKKLRIAFYGCRFIKSEEYKDVPKIKQVQLLIQVYDRDDKKIEIYENPFILSEKQYQKPKKIPGTDHYIEAEFIYMPKNLWRFLRIPDFVILSIKFLPKTDS